MCTYCMVADDFNNRFWQPFKNWPDNIPHTTFPWNRERVQELEDLIKRVEQLENKLGPCPCPDESKMNFIKEIREKLDEIESRERAGDGGSAI